MIIRDSDQLESSYDYFLTSQDFNLLLNIQL
jgi:hypothetical protein